MGAASRADSPVGEVAAFDPLMGRLEVIEPGIAMFHGFANVAFAYGGGEMLATDTSSPHMGALAVKAIREVTLEPFAFLIYTHGHGDHAFGTEAFITDNLSRGYRRPKIWAHEEVMARFERYRRTRGWQAHINSLQFGLRMAPDAMFADTSFTLPDLTYRDTQLLELEREPVELRHAMGETDDATWVWMPRRRLAMVGYLIVSSLPNTGNPNKVQRYTLEWAAALEQIAARKPRIVLPGHGPAYRGEEICHELLSETARALRIIHDEVVARLNRGEWPVDIVEADIQLPDDLASKPFLRPMYGCVPFVVRDVIRRYAGWWSGQPSQMFPAKRSEVAAEILGLCGRDQLLARAQSLKDDGKLPQALAIAEMALDANTADAEAIVLNAEILEAMAAAESSLLRATFSSPRRATCAGASRLHKEIRGGGEMTTIGKAKQLTIYLGETDKHEHRALYMAIIEWLRTNKIAGATATRGIAGYGASSHLHTANILTLSTDMPIVITVVDKPETIDSIIAPLAALAPNAMVTVHEVEVVHAGVGLPHP